MMKTITLARIGAALSVLAAVAVVPVIISNHTPYALDIKRPVAGACALAAGLSLLVWWLAGGRPGRKVTRIVLFLSLFLAGLVVSTAFSDYPGTTLRETWWHAAHVILFLATALAFRRPGWARALLVAVFVAAAFVAFYGIAQYKGYDLQGRRWSKSERNIELGAPNVRVLGTLGLETALGGYMATCSVLAVGTMFVFRRWWARMLVALTAIMTACCMVFSGTRSALFAFMAGLFILGVLWLWKFRGVLARRRNQVFLLVLAAGLLLLVPFAPWQRIQNVWKDMSIRTTIWRAAWASFRDTPITGKGPGTFGIYFAQFRPSDFRTNAAAACPSCLPPPPFRQPGSDGRWLKPGLRVLHGEQGKMRPSPGAPGGI